LFVGLCIGSFIVGCIFWVLFHRFDRKEDGMNSLNAKHDDLGNKRGLNETGNDVTGDANWWEERPRVAICNGPSYLHASGIVIRYRESPALIEQVGNATRTGLGGTAQVRYHIVSGKYCGGTKYWTPSHRRVEFRLYPTAKHEKLLDL
jgi:hypothetical protein